MAEVQQSQFSLKKLTVKSTGLIYTEYNTEIPDGNETYIKSHKDESTMIPHPDLKAPLEQMKKMLLDAWSLDETSPLAAEINVKGITLSGSEDKRTIIISGTKVIRKSNLKVPCGSGKISLGANTFGFEEELEVCVNHLIDEAFKFIYENKKAQMDIAFKEDVPKTKKKSKKVDEETESED